MFLVVVPFTCCRPLLGGHFTACWICLLFDFGRELSPLRVVQRQRLCLRGLLLLT
jgi:hypothetical protein